MLAESLHPSLQAALTLGGLDPEKFNIGTPILGDRSAPRPPRTEVFLVGEGNHFVTWNVASLSALYRGSRRPPDLKDYPPEYVPVFAAIEQRVWFASRVERPATDGELEEIYSNLRRRPDGRSLGAMHDAIWQVAALTLGMFPLSEAEFEGVFARLGKSARQWKESPTSRNYLAGLARMFERG